MFHRFPHNGHRDIMANQGLNSGFMAFLVALLGSSEHYDDHDNNDHHSRATYDGSCGYHPSYNSPSGNQYLDTEPYDVNSIRHDNYYDNTARHRVK